jgi:hypothetical protein
MLNIYNKTDGESVSTANIATAKLIKPIHLSLFNGLSVLLPAGTNILVDTVEEIACAEGNHFDIDSSEYQIIQAESLTSIVSNGILTKDVKFHHPKVGPIEIPMGSVVKIDLQEKIAFYADVHFDIESDEFYVSQ